MISVMILTRNEELDLPGCLRSAAWSDDIHVFDSGSTDRTLEIAREAGARITQRAYPPGAPAFGGDESEHRNWGLRSLPFKYPWVLALDADERVSDSLRQAALRAVGTPGDRVAFRIRRRDHFMGQWLKHVQASPYYIRLFRPERITHERLINTRTVVDGPVGDVDGFLDHYPFSKGVDWWVERHNGYSRFEARQIVENRRSRPSFSIWRAFASRDFHERRFHQKELFYRLPCRPTLKFLLLYVMKRGFLDGRAGFTYARLQSIYEYFIVLKVREIEIGSRDDEAS